MPEVYSDILKELRKDRGITQKEMARRLGIRATLYNFYETGRREMRIWMLDFLADELGTSTDYILGRTGVETPYPRRPDPKEPKAPESPDSPPKALTNTKTADG